MTTNQWPHSPTCNANCQGHTKAPTPDPYEHLYAPSAYGDVIRPLLQAKEAVERNLKAVVGTHEGWALDDVLWAIGIAIEYLGYAHDYDGDKSRGEEEE